MSTCANILYPIPSADEVWYFIIIRERVGSQEWTVVGAPLVPTASVLLQVEEHARTAKVHIFKKKRVRV